MENIKPWGSYTILIDTPLYKIKLLKLSPGKRISLQKHTHRQEHWIVTSGLARVTIESEVKDLYLNDYIHILENQIHRLENIGENQLTIIEIQIGDYISEDDIIRLEDDFGRA